MDSSFSTSSSSDDYAVIPSHIRHTSDDDDDDVDGRTTATTTNSDEDNIRNRRMSTTVHHFYEIHLLFPVTCLHLTPVAHSIYIPCNLPRQQLGQLDRQSPECAARGHYFSSPVFLLITIRILARILHHQQKTKRISIFLQQQRTTIHASCSLALARDQPATGSSGDLIFGTAPQKRTNTEKRSKY